MKFLIFTALTCILSFCSCQKDNSNELRTIETGFSVESNSIYPKTVNYSAFSCNTTDEFIWDFGDGQTAIGCSVEHTYNDYGSYRVTLATHRGISKAIQTVELKKDCDNKGVAYIVINNPAEDYSYTLYKNGSFMKFWEGGVQSILAVSPGYYTLEARKINDTSIIIQKSMELQVCDELIWPIP